MNELNRIGALAAEVNRATAAGDHNRAKTLADLIRRLTPRVNRERKGHAIAVPPPRLAQREEGSW